MGDPVDIIKDVGLNLVTGGLYSVGKGIIKTVKTGNPMHLLGQGFSVGLAGLGNDLATRLGGPTAGLSFNLAGLGIGLAGGGLSGVFSGGFGTAGAGGAAPLVAPPVGAIPVTAGAAESAVTGASIAGETLGGPVGAVAGTAAPAAGATGGLANLAGLPAGTVAGSTASQLLPSVTKAAPETAGYLGELKNMAPALNSMPTDSWFASLSPGAQTALITGGFTVAQMATGAMGGLFAGATAQKKLELEQLINQQNQAQVQYRNKNNQYAPMLKFTHPNTGLINTPVA